MWFKAWHYLGRIGSLILFPLLLVTFFASNTSVWREINQYAIIALFSLGLSGAAIAILTLFAGFRFRCSKCRRNNTEFGGDKNGAWMQCLDCGHTLTESGFLKLKLYEEDVIIPKGKIASNGPICERVHEDPADRQKVFFSGKYSYRRRSSLLVGSGILIGFGIILGRLVHAAIIKPPQVTGDIAIAIAILLIPGLLAYCGIYLVYGYVRNKTCELIISAAGVIFAGKCTSWTKLKWISAHFEKGTYQLAVGRRGFAADLHISVDGGLSEEQLAELFETLEKEIGAKYPHLRIG